MALKVIHVPFTYYPDAVGGTEVYVSSLARNLQSVGIESVIAAPSSTQRSELYEHEGTRVRRFPISSESRNMLSELYGDGDPHAAAKFGEILDGEQPDVVHLHSFTRGVSLRTAREVKQRGIKLVFTYHTPTVSCQRGTLLRDGVAVCDGLLDQRTCSRCKLQSLGVNRFTCKMLSLMPYGVGSLLSRAHLEGGLWTGLRMSELTARSHSSFRNLMREADAVVALCQWSRDLLLRNGVAADKVTLSRHGLPYVINDSGSATQLSPDERPLRIVFLGRADRTKGCDVLIDALQLHPNLKVKLDVYGVHQGPSGEAHGELLKSLAASDSRIRFLPAVPGEKVVELLRSYHLLAVPSRWLETGPLVVLEAFAAGIPVIGSKLGGIAELISHNVDGLLVESESVSDWATVIQQLHDDPILLNRLRGNIQPPRSMTTVAKEMASLYARIDRSALSHTHNQPIYAHR